MKTNERAIEEGNKIRVITGNSTRILVPWSRTRESRQDIPEGSEVLQKVKWTITTSADISLNFAVYVGCMFGLISRESYNGEAPLWPYKHMDVGTNQPEVITTFAEEWRKWWLQLIEKRASNLMQGIVSPVSELFKPPAFEGLTMKGLGECCQKAWPLFKEWWQMPAGGGTAIGYWGSFRRLEEFFRKFVNRSEKPLNRFSLDIDLVYTGINEVIEVNQNYIIVPLFPELFTDEMWKACQ